MRWTREHAGGDFKIKNNDQQGRRVVDSPHHQVKCPLTFLSSACDGTTVLRHRNSHLLDHIAAHIAASLSSKLRMVLEVVQGIPVRKHIKRAA